MSGILLLLTHLAASAAGALIAHRVTLRTLTVREVEGERLVTVQHRPHRGAPAAVAWVALVASLIVILIGTQALIATRQALEESADNTATAEANSRAIVDLECDDAWGWVALLELPRDPEAPPITEQERETRKAFLARKLRVIEELNCPTPVEVIP